MFSKQEKFVNNCIKSFGKRIILAGDFNIDYEGLKKYFPGLVFLSGRIKTLFSQGVLKLWSNKDVDHILARGIKAKACGYLIGYSDHKLVWADLKFD